MRQTLLVVRVIHLAFISTWFLFIFLLLFLHPQEQPVPVAYPIVLGVFSVSNIQVCLLLRKRLVYEPAKLLEAEPENQVLLNRWRAGNIVSFTLAESTMLFGVFLKLLGAGWKIVAIFFAAGLVLQLLWTPRDIKTKP